MPIIDLSRLAMPSGALAMIALDQREALRGMLGAGGWSRRDVSDEYLTEFKLAACQSLSPHASAVLLDMALGAVPAVAAGAIASSCALVVAADTLDGPRGGAVEDSRRDSAVDLARMCRQGADAFKLLVIWTRDGNRVSRQAMIRTFVADCHKVGRPAIVEALVREPGVGGGLLFDPKALLAAAREVAEAGPDLYKAQVPLRGTPTVADGFIVKACEAISAAVKCPWVVLSSGIGSEDFPRALALACQGGASGFLAGRAVWAGALAARDYRHGLKDLAVQRLDELANIADRTGRPWQYCLR